MALGEIIVEVEGEVGVEEHGKSTFISLFSFPELEEEDEHEEEEEEVEEEEEELVVEEIELERW